MGVVEEPDEEGDGAWDVDEGVHAVDPGHHELVLHKELLDGDLIEDAQTLLGRNDLQRVPARRVDGALDDPYGGRGSSQLIDLYFLIRRGRLEAHPRTSKWQTYPVDQRPIPTLNQEGEALEQAAQEVALEPARVGRGQRHAEGSEADLPLAPARLLGDQQTGRHAACLDIDGHGHVHGALGGPAHLARASSSARVGMAIDPRPADQQRDDHQGFCDGADASHATYYGYRVFQRGRAEGFEEAKVNLDVGVVAGEAGGRASGEQAGCHWEPEDVTGRHVDG